MKRLFLTGAGLLATVAPALAQAANDTNDAATQIKDTTLLNLMAAAGWVILPLALASMITLTLIIYCFFTLTEKSITTPELLERMEPFFENEDLDGLAAYVADRPQACARMVDSILRFLERHPDADAASISAVAESEGGRVVASLNQRVLYIMDVGVLAPLLGLFGTVVGILHSFGQIGDPHQTAMRTMLLAGGVSQALISTAMGLTVGITAMAFYAYFRGRVNRLVSVLEVEGTLLTQELILLSKRHRVKP